MLPTYHAVGPGMYPEFSLLLSYSYVHYHSIPYLRAAPYKSQEKVYDKDQLANETDHLEIRLPPYYCQYNPVKLI